MFSRQSIIDKQIKGDGITYSRLLNSIEKLVYKVKRLNLNNSQGMSVIDCLTCLKNLIINLSIQYHDIPKDILNQVSMLLINIQELIEPDEKFANSDSIQGRIPSNMNHSPRVDSPRTRESLGSYISPVNREISPKVGSFTISPRIVRHSPRKHPDLHQDSESEFEDDEDEIPFMNRYDQRNRL